MLFSKFLKKEAQVLTCLIIALAFSVDVFAQERPEKPNLIIILADDLGWQDLKCYDVDEPSPFESPYIDALAERGVQFWQAYSPAPTCSPSRGAILTGKHPARLNREHVVGGEIPKPQALSSWRLVIPYYKGRLELSELTLPEALAPLNYFSGHVGKWHIAVGHNTFPEAEDHGFDWSRKGRGITYNMGDINSNFATTDPDDPYQLDENGFAFDQVTQDALDFLTEATTGSETENNPFFLYYATWLVHTPIQIRTESLLIKYADKMGYDYPLDGSEILEIGQTNPYYAAMVETFDYNVHQIFNYLENTDDPRWPGHKLIENTYVFITSDNGGAEGRASWNYTDNAPLDRGKSNTREGGTRVPFIAIGPDIPADIESDVMVSGLDLFPTLVSLAGGAFISPVDGCDLSSLLFNDPQDATLVSDLEGNLREALYWHFPLPNNFNSTIRKNGWKLFQNYDIEDSSSEDAYRLYQLYTESGERNDIEEAVDLASAHPEIVEALADELNAFLVDAEVKKPNYNPSYTGTLPNTDAVPAIIAKGDSGGIAWVRYETGKAAIVNAYIYYTLNGSANNEEWFEGPAEVVYDGRVEAGIPAGTTHYMLMLIDENNFMIPSEYVGQRQSQGDDSEQVSPYTFIDAEIAPQFILLDDDLSSASLGTNTRLLRRSTGFVKHTDSAWTLTGGVLSNSSTVNNRQSEGAVARILDLSSITDEIANIVNISFDYALSESNETLYMHVWGLVDIDSETDTQIMNLAATNGNAWVVAEPNLTVYNLGKPNGNFSGTMGIASDAAIVLTGTTGQQTYRATLDLSSFTSAPDHIAAYDYLVIGFSREISGNAASATIENIQITTNGADDYAVWAYNASLIDDGIAVDPDTDGTLNIMEYALGGDPSVADAKNLPYMFINSDAPEVITFVYFRRHDHATRNIEYIPEIAQDLSSDTWDSLPIVEVRTELIDEEFERVTNFISRQNGNAGFVRLKVESSQ